MYECVNVFVNVHNWGLGPWVR